MSTESRWLRSLVAGLSVSFAGLALFSATTPVHAQLLPQTRVYAVFPAGGQRGTPVPVTVANGADLDEATRLIFSHPGITAVPKTQPVEGKEVPVANQFVVTIAADVPVGTYDVRAAGKFGVSNPRAFVVGDRPEVLETEPNNELAKAQVVTTGTVVNGRSDGGTDLDFYKFTATANQRVLVDVRARRLDSRMSPVVEILDANGRKLLLSRHSLRRDALADFTPTADGEYFIKVYDSVYGGSADHPYRLSLHAGPHIDFVLPVSVLPGTTAELTLYGRNLPGGQPSPFKVAGGKVLDMLKVQIPVPADGSTAPTGELLGPAEGSVSGFTYSLPSPAGSSNAVSLYYASTPTGLEVEPNDNGAQAQKVVPPLEISGQFATRGDADFYAFDAKAGQILWIEAYGQRSGGPTDPYFIVQQVVKNDKGEETVNQMALVDDNPVNLGGNQFNTTGDDPSFKFVAPADGTYRVAVRDRYGESRGDPSLTYRLAIREETPDFRLAVVPAVPSADPNQIVATWETALRKGDSVALNVMAYRMDGYIGPIDVSVEGLPAGVTTRGTTVAANQNAATLVLTSTPEAADFAGTIKIVGKAKIESPPVAREMVAAEAALKAATAAVKPLEKPVTDAQAAVKAATDKANAAKEALDKDANNEGLKKQKADADAALVKAQEVLKTAETNKQAAEAKVAEGTQAVTAAKVKLDQTAKETIREARAGTVVWNGSQQLAAQSRLAQSIVLAVVPEKLPFRAVVEGERKFEVNQGRQILIPVNVPREAGFETPVAFAFVNPPQNLQVENKPVEKDKPGAVYRLYVANNVAPGAYTFLLQGTAQISYRRNPEAADAAQKAKEAADKALVDAMEAVKKGTEAKAVADKKVVDTAALAKKGVDDKAVADKGMVDADAAAKKADEEKAVAVKAATDAETAAKTAAEAAVKAKAEADAKTDDKALQDAKVAAEKLAADTAATAKTAGEAKVAAEKKHADAVELAKKAAEAKVAADKVAADTAAAAKVAADEKVVVEKTLADATAAQAKATATKQAADKLATDTANVAKPQNVNLVKPAEAFTIVVKQGPGTLAAAPANNGTVARGASLEIKVNVNRANGFAGPVKLSLPLPPGVAGLVAPEVEIPADKNEGTLVVQVAGDATQGALPNMVVRGSMEFSGPAAVDQPVTITVQ